MMRFEKGSQVEVFVHSENAPSGAWRCCEIVSGNGRTYDVKYEYGLCTIGAGNMERVSRRNIRPCPPNIEGSHRWMMGYRVEVFDSFLWKQAVVLKCMIGGQYLVRMLGSGKEHRIHKVHIRPCQLWQDGKWVVIKEGLGLGEKVKSNKQSRKSQPASTKAQTGANRLAMDNNIAAFQESCVGSARMLKRVSPLWSSDADVHNAKNKKVRAIGKNAERPLVIDKEYAVACPQENFGEPYMYSPSNHKRRCGSLERCCSDLDACSVGSCSVINHPGIPAYPMSEDTRPDEDSLTSDAESFCGRPDEENYYQVLFGEHVEGIIRSFELQAYRCTLEALYASGPLSWEREALLTDLRISLNISNDEHSRELKNLISPGTTILID